MTMLFSSPHPTLRDFHTKANLETDKKFTFKATVGRAMQLPGSFLHALWGAWRFDTWALPAYCTALL